MQEENNKLFVGNLSFEVKEDQLADLFASIEGVEVVSAKVITDRETGRPRGFGFVEVKTSEMAQKAITEMNGKEVDGRNLVVNISRPMSSDRGGSRGGYQGNRGGYQGNNGGGYNRGR